MISKQYRSEITKILFMMAEVFRDTFSDASIDGWVMVLQSEGVTIDEARAAAVEVMKSREYNKLPTPAVFLDLLRPKEDFKALAQEQADLVLGAVQKLGPYKLPEFEDRKTAAMVARTGWRNLCDKSSDDLKWWLREFVGEYADSTSREKKRLSAPKLKVLKSGE